MMGMRRLAMVAVMMVVAAPAAAQDQEPPRVSVTFGAGVANPLHGDLSFVAPAWQASLRVAASPHFLLAVSYGEWRHTKTRETTGVVFRGASGNVLGQADRIIERTGETRPEIALNFLGAWSAGRATITAGGGPGLMLYRRHYTTTYEGCSSATLPCTGYDNRFSSGSFSIQAEAGLEVRIASRIGAFGAFRLSVPVEDAGAGQTAFLGGVRVAVF